MTPAALAALHAAAFTTERSWSAQEFDDLLASPYVVVFTQPHGFALTRSIADESELLTLAVDSAHRRAGIASHLLHAWLHSISPTCKTAFLEVAADNTGAIALYERHGFAKIATRTGYYQRKDAPAADALIYQLDPKCALTGR